jgi:DNA-directed RNA polymerase subunit RPC12/RpoP
MAEDIFYCPNCGGVMEFDVATQKLKCPNCDHVVDIANHRENIVEHSLTKRAMQTVKAEQKESTTLQCKGCGAQMEVGAYNTAVTCPYCGSSYVLAEKQEEVIIPDGVVPFKIDKNSAKEIVGKWLKKRYLAPGELKMLYQRGDIFGMYIPYWTFDADANADYTGMGGRYRQEHYRDRDGRDHTRTVTDWYPTRGHVHNFFDDVLVSASSHQKKSLLNGVDDYDTRQLVSYASDYFSGYGAESFYINL